MTDNTEDEGHGPAGKSLGHQLYQQARALMDAGKYQEAVIVFEQSADEQPHAKTYELLGECLMHLDRHKEAIPFLAAATTLNLNVRPPSLLAEAWVQMEQYSRASDAIKIALARDPTNKKALGMQAIVDQSKR